MSLAVNKTITIILVILLVTAVLIWYFKSDILNYLKNLIPSYNSSDEEIDIKMPEITDRLAYPYINLLDNDEQRECKNGGIKVGEAGITKKPIEIINSKIYFYNKDVGTVTKEGDTKKLSISSNFLDFKNEFYQQIRYRINKPPEKLVETLARLHRSNFETDILICRDKTINVSREIQNYYKGILLENLKLEVSEKYKTISLFPYLNYPADKVKFLFLEYKDNYVYINGKMLSGKDVDFFGVIKSDGSVWLTKYVYTSLIQQAYPYISRTENPISLSFGAIYLGNELNSYYETNIRVNYKKIMYFLAEK